MHYKEVKGILSATNGMNIYRGCSHGCIYCDSRSTCYNITHEFTDIEVKSNVCELLEQKLISKRKKCMIGTGSMTDPYIHIEAALENIDGIINYCIEAKVYGIICFGMGLTLREGNREYFYSKLDEHFTGLKEKYIKTYGNVYAVNSKNNNELMKYLKEKCKENNIVFNNDELFSYMHTYPLIESNIDQLNLFNI